MMLLLRELKIMLRSPAGAIQSLMFAVLVIALFPLAITPDPDQLEPLGIGLIWVVTLLSCLLAADKSLASDYADGSLEQMVLSDYPLWWVCLVKSMAHWVSCALPLLLMAPILGGMLAMPLDRIVWLMASLILGSPILSLFCILGAMLTVGLNQSSALLPILIAPFLVPTLILGTQWATTGGEAFYGYMLAALLCLSLVTLPFATAVVAKIAVSR
ncbi:MAG TPA: heme exporter protein CcmB [Gammaproteobacteria bacterium]|nr:heme exporter protein CcmB [Gammaproteobacteria bacterium]